MIEPLPERRSKKFKDIPIGSVIGKRTVLELVGKIGAAYAWRVRCECGREDVLTSSKLLSSGRANRCIDCRNKYVGDLQRSRQVILTGRVFGKLNVTGISASRGNKGRVALWDVKCVCGQIGKTSSADLLSGHTKQCRKCADVTRGLKNSIDETGHSYGDWLVLSFHSINDTDQTMYLARCSCGLEKVVSIASLKAKESTGCNQTHCMRRRLKAHLPHKSVVPKVRSELTKKGGSLYYLLCTYGNMLQRCYNPDCPAYKYYGHKGVTICDRWLYSFERFCEDMGERGDGMCIDRINPFGNYEPSNCRWVDVDTSCHNKRANFYRQAA